MKIAHVLPRSLLRMHRSAPALACASALALAAQSAAATWFVAPGGTGTGTGSWSNATNDLQVALAGAVNGDEVWVAEGTYVPGTARSDSFVIPDGVEVYGGFLGTEASVAGRLGSFLLTNLDGDNGGNPALSSDNAYHVVTADPAGGTSGNAIVLDGFLVTNGNADGGGVDDLGGGLLVPGGGSVYYELVEVRNCTFEGNAAQEGGGAHVVRVVQFNMDLCVFRANLAAEKGGGLYLYEIGGGSCEEGDGTHVHRTLFDGNYAVYEGGGLWFDLPDAPVRLVNDQWHDNVAALGGAVYAGDTISYETRIVNCTLAYNTALIAGATGPAGGGLYLADSTGNVAVHNTIIWGNVADHGGILAPGSSIDGPGAADPNLVDYSDIEIKPLLIGGGPVWAGTGNLNANPGFQNVPARNLRLGPFSACIDAGNDTLVCFDKLDYDADSDLHEQVTTDFTAVFAREINDAGVTDTGVNDGGTNSYSDCFGSASSATPLDTGVVDMGCFERRVMSGS